MKFFKTKYIFSSIVILFVLSIFISLVETPKAEYSFGYILGLSFYLFLTWGIFLSVIIFLITLVIGIIRKNRKESPKKMFITSAISISTSVILFILLGVVAIITENVSESLNETEQKSVASASQNNLIVEKTIDAGDFRIYRSSEETRWIFYDNAMFEDNFDGFKFQIHPLALSNKSEFYQNKYLGAVGSLFTISNESSSNFRFNSTELQITTNKNHPLNQNDNTNKIKNTTFKPGDKINDPKQGMITFISDSTDLETVDWVNFKFEIAQLNENGDVVKNKKYNIKFNITNHFTDTQTEIKKPDQSEVSPTKPSNGSSNSTLSGTNDNNKQIKKYSLESDITSLIEDKITNAEIDKIEVNEHLGTQEDGDYIALIHLKFKPKNSNETTLKLIDLYNNEIGAQLAKQKEIQEVTIFWEAPYIKEDMNIVKANLQRNGDNMIFNNTWIAPLMK
ncbi:TPA: hypothetical protein ACOQ39_003556 [Bacillus cereus]|uniref:hypothetical protein n=1 Tax=Bacillus cereus TaxID=1396 RepID=UPI001925B476|nr:hypothetical protein [Bacillus cereus]MBL3880877.1 hypothetical protein [Bacillus cereus]HDR7977107.1 hypothetical protein [Bacillus cereus]HDR8073766.1 hypothetical protein [Bacillus cereus]HDR8216164.1 hypothetical protein [Bacillus cereus]HDR8232457.1 hypothetical protein [Bacillus cereus]